MLLYKYLCFLVLTVVLFLLTQPYLIQGTNVVYTNVETLHVEASSLWSDYSKSTLLKGQSMTINVPNDQTWTDWYIETTAEGYTNYFGVTLRYVGDNTNLFALICCMNQKLGTCQYVGVHNVYVAPEDGQLTCFANDVSYMYWNNKGSLDIELTIT